MKKILFSLLLITALIMSVSAVSAHHYYNDNSYTYEKIVSNNYWGRTVEINRDSKDSTMHYFKSTSPGYSTARVYNAWGYVNPKPYYSNTHYTKTKRSNYYTGSYYNSYNRPNYYDRGNYYTGGSNGYYRWRY